jgi:hypothetical protein
MKYRSIPTHRIDRKNSSRISDIHDKVLNGNVPDSSSQITFFCARPLDSSFRILEASLQIPSPDDYLDFCVSFALTRRIPAKPFTRTDSPKMLHLAWPHNQYHINYASYLNSALKTEVTQTGSDTNTVRCSIRLIRNREWGLVGFVGYDTVQFGRWLPTLR